MAARTRSRLPVLVSTLVTWLLTVGRVIRFAALALPLALA